MWQGMANYECGLCAYATLDRGAMATHMRAAHAVVGGFEPDMVVVGAVVETAVENESDQGDGEQ
jgi:hypothetical protein